jgi:hypothetical protein
MLELGLLPGFSTEALAELTWIIKEFDDEYKDD